jgi:hypothetical protein
VLPAGALPAGYPCRLRSPHFPFPFREKENKKKGSHNFEIKKSHKTTTATTTNVRRRKKKGKRTFVPSSVTVLAASLEENQLSKTARTGKV